MERQDYHTRDMHTSRKGIVSNEDVASFWSQHNTSHHFTDFPFATNEPLPVNRWYKAVGRQPLVFTYILPTAGLVTAIALLVFALTKLRQFNNSAMSIP